MRFEPLSRVMTFWFKHTNVVLLWAGFSEQPLHALHTPSANPTNETQCWTSGASQHPAPRSGPAPTTPTRGLHLAIKIAAYTCWEHFTCKSTIL